MAGAGALKNPVADFVRSNKRAEGEQEGEIRPPENEYITKNPYVDLTVGGLERQQKFQERQSHLAGGRMAICVCISYSGLHLLRTVLIFFIVTILDLSNCEKSQRTSTGNSTLYGDAKVS